MIRTVAARARAPIIGARYWLPAYLRRVGIVDPIVDSALDWFERNRVGGAGGGDFAGPLTQRGLVPT